MADSTPSSYKFFTDSVVFEQVDIKGQKQHYVTGYISTKDKDLVNDIITDSALHDMVRQIESKNIKLDVDHEIWREENPNIIPIGRIIEAKKDDRGIFVKAVLNQSHSQFNEVWGSVQNKFIDAFSIAYKAIKKVDKVIDGVKTRILDKVDLLNVALTGNPVNPHCTMTSVFTKSLNEFKEENTMEDEKAPVEEVPKEEVKDVPKEEVTEEPVADDTEVKSLKESLDTKDAEIKSIQSELKSKDETLAEFKSKMEAQDKEMKSLKEKMENPIMKAAQKSMEQATVDSKRPMSPLDAI